MTRGAVRRSAIRLTTRREREAFRQIKRACLSGLASVPLREEVARCAAGVVPNDAAAITTTDPETGLFLHGWSVGISDSMVREYMSDVYPEEIFDNFEIARSERPVSTFNSDRIVVFLRGKGFGFRARTALCVDGGVWGTWCQFRSHEHGAFCEGETRFLHAVSSYIGYGLRSASMLDTARTSDVAAPMTTPGVVTFDFRHRIRLRSGPVTDHFADLASVGTDPELLPHALHSLLVMLERSRSTDGIPGPVQLRAQGKSGRWYTLRGTLSEPDEFGASYRVVVIEPKPVMRDQAALFHLYGLTTRERDVLRLALKGESTKTIAAGLELSVYTVQEHLGKVYDKVGVRGRRALLARLLSDGYRPFQSKPMDSDQ